MFRLTWPGVLCKEIIKVNKRNDILFFTSIRKLTYAYKPVKTSWEEVISFVSINVNTFSE